MGVILTTYDRDDPPSNCWISNSGRSQDSAKLQEFQEAIERQCGEHMVSWQLSSYVPFSSGIPWLAVFVNFWLLHIFFKARKLSMVMSFGGFFKASV